MFGHINGTHVGQVFESRKELASAGIHKPLMSGIWGAQEGAYSIVLSGGYEDDVDDLDYILYTGQGGQDVPGGKQVADQVFTKGNLGLQLSCQYGLPVRVSRGHQITNGPNTGYRYDGLYYVKGFERIKGKRGFYICRFHLVSENSFELLHHEIASNLKDTYQTPNRKEFTTHRLERNVKLSEKIKKIYSYRCQVCDVLLETPSGPVAIGAHIQGLGRPHNGPDVIENMLCLCPNHHDQFDYRAFYIDPENLLIVGLPEFEKRKLKKSPRHEIGEIFLRHQQSLYYQNINKL